MRLVSSQLIERSRRNGFAPDADTLETRFQYASKVFGSCVERLGSTADALPPGVQ
jgi:hypothetical protein